jgi:cob(I)alamin adenosyltransferase
MVYLSRIYTKTGDDGTTALGNGQRVRKDDPRVEAYGAVDELNAVLGLLVAHHPQVDELPLLQLIQNDLFDVGADLCTPQSPEEKPNERLRVTAGQVVRLEGAIDRLNEGLPPLASFVLAGGQPAAAWCHLARTVCRRAERRVVHLMQQAFVNPQVLLYLNRLSDLLFVLCRHLNGRGANDVLWQPGKGRS